MLIHTLCLLTLLLWDVKCPMSRVARQVRLRGGMLGFLYTLSGYLGYTMNGGNSKVEVEHVIH
jgi:hypothetical protein